MIVDSSALISVATGEQGHERIANLLADSPRSRIGAPTLLVTGMVLEGRAGARGRTALARISAEARLEVLPFTEEHARIALDAFARFGQGRHLLPGISATAAVTPLLSLPESRCSVSVRTSREPILSWFR